MSIDPRERASQIVNGYRVFRLAAVVIGAGIPERLLEGPRTAEELASCARERTAAEHTREAAPA